MSDWLLSPEDIFRIWMQREYHDQIEFGQAIAEAQAQKMVEYMEEAMGTSENGEYHIGEVFWQNLKDAIMNIKREV